MDAQKTVSRCDAGSISHKLHKLYRLLVPATRRDPAHPAPFFFWTHHIALLAFNKFKFKCTNKIGILDEKQISCFQSELAVESGRPEDTIHIVNRVATVKM